MTTEIISTRIEKQDLKAIDLFAKEEHLDRSTFLKKLVYRSLEEYKLAHAFELYSEGKISLGKAAEMAGRSLWDMIELLPKHDIHLNYGKEDLEDDLATIKNL